jgi:predicted ATP-grasp superfamily ATP-dependent carboligase
MPELSTAPPMMERQSGGTRAGAQSESALPPAIILGGEANALSVARSLARLGVRVYAMGDAESVVSRSRCCRWIRPLIEGGLEASWARWLMGDESDELKGAVVLACGDAGIRVLARHREALLERFTLDESNPTAQMEMLDKVTTYQNAVAAGVPTPKFWVVESRQQVLDLRDQLVFPLIVKPRLSHVFEEKFGKKYLNAPNFEQVLAGVDAASAAGVEVLLMEWIPGPDTRLCSYFTYLTEDGTPLFHFTKRIIRRYPAGMGPACYHITDWIPELVEPSLKLFRHVGLRGLANVEYKQDPRDGQYKLIECNARFVASNALVASAGFDLAALVYNRLTGRAQPHLQKFRSGLRMWDPGRDWTAFRQLRAAGQITFPQWLASIAHRQTFPWFAWSDPMPAVARLLRGLNK